VREITDTEPAVKARDTSGKVLKNAKIATTEISVPLFVQTGDKIEIDTRTHEYRKRVSLGGCTTAAARPFLFSLIMVMSFDLPLPAPRSECSPGCAGSRPARAN
jgi:hypothetical protein